MRSRFNPYLTNLPVTEVISDVRKHLADQNTLLITAPPGAGKSTVLPLALLDEEWLGGKKIIVLEPRRLAATSIANRMADLLNEPVGGTIGYRIRFDNKTSRQTRIEVVTEGILTRMLHHDNALEDVGLIIFDEFHERSIHADIALALSRQVQELLRPDLRLMVMSATLDVAPLAEMLKAPIVESKGAMYPVEVIYTGEQDIRQIAELSARTIVKATREQDGDLLAFLPGQAEIRKCSEILRGQLSGFAIHALYGKLSNAEQQASLVPDPAGRRKVVLATSIAETSLTIQGVRIVVDSGYTRKSVFDPGTGLSGLKTVQVSVDSADQRTGRAGRLSSGTCYRMWSPATQSRLAPFRTPEILDSDLTPLVLDLYEWGISDAGSLCWLNSPPPVALKTARDLLNALGAIEGSRLTSHGKRIHRLPCHPRLANMLIMAESAGTLPLATDIAALLEERDPFDRLSAGADLNLRVEHLRRYRSDQRRDPRWEKIEKAAAAYRQLFGVAANQSAIDPYSTGLLLAHAYPERIAKIAGEGSFRLANGQSAILNREDDLSHESYLAIAELDSQKGQGKVFLAAPLNPEDVSHLATETENIRWDNRKGQLLATSDLRIGSLVLETKALESPDLQKVEQVIADTIRTEGRGLLNFGTEVQQWQSRVLSLRKWNPGQNWPDVRTEILLQENETWLGPYFGQLRKAEDFRRIDLADVLHHFLDYEQQTWLDRLAPSAITVPSGSSIKLLYQPGGEDPVLAVRLQEVFGLLDTPKVNDGRNSVVLHLLSPGYKPVQITSDLRSFWQNAYFEVRKELKRRYPKHSWPEDPLQAEAVRGVRKK
jgi:ATP-dependent helicase HrpB